MNATVKAPMPVKTAVQLLEEGKTRLAALLQRRTKAEVEIEAARRQFSEAQQEALREFGTGDLDELRALYVQSEAENERKVAQFLRELDALEAAVTDAESQLSG